MADAAAPSPPWCRPRPATSSSKGKSRGLYSNDVSSHADVYTALECLAGVLAALYQRERTGRGQWVEVSMAETMLCVNDGAHWNMTGREPEGGAVPNFGPGDYPVLALGNGRRIVIAGHPVDSGMFDQFVAAMERPDLLTHPLLAERCRAHRAPRHRRRGARRRGPPRSTTSARSRRRWRPRAWRWAWCAR